MPIRALAIAALLCAGMPASAQQRSSDPAIERWEADAVRRVWTYLEVRDCAGALQELNGGLSRQYAVVMVMAGAMYEDGLCLTPNADRAIAMFDKASALWWAQRSGQGVTEFCGGSALPLDDADAFVKGQSTWPPARLDTCTYAAGVLGMIQGDTEFPNRAAAFGMRGSVQLVFSPAVPSFEVRGTDIDKIELGVLINGDALSNDRVTVKNEFVCHMQAMTQRALQRSAQPQAIPISWKFALEYKFQYS